MWREHGPLPSYQEATSGPDWIQLVAPYCDFEDCRALCLVSRRFWNTFAPLLWRDLLRAARLSGLDPGDDLAWWRRFAFDRLDKVSHLTRAQVRVLDARHFAKTAYSFSSLQTDRTLTETLRRAVRLLPNVHAMLLDGHADVNVPLLMGHDSADSGLSSLWVLSVAGCSRQLPKSFFTLPRIQTLVYLDLSDNPGSLLPLAQPGLLPSLRVLKIKGRELDDCTLHQLMRRFGRQLWSLDVTNNNVTDEAIQHLGDRCFPDSQVRSSARSEIEGRIITQPGGSSHYGRFLHFEESLLSPTFSHPERFFVDSPAYTARADATAQASRGRRSDGGAPVVKDDAGAAISALVDLENLELGQRRQNCAGLTHLHLSGNNGISSTGIQKLLYVSQGHIEGLSCDSAPILPRSADVSKVWPPNASLSGFIGAAHCFRPALSCNLRALRLHHSVVTNIPTLDAQGLSKMERLLIAETTIRERAEGAYPQTLVPDMNPRLSSLTLTCLPRRSSGPLISRLIQFLKLLSLQERAIQDLSSFTASTRRGPTLLKGLRHLRLEFEPDCMDDGLSTLTDWEAEELIEPGEGMFSFFGQEWAAAGRRVLDTQASLPRRPRLRAPKSGEADDGNGAVVEDHQLVAADRDTAEFLTHHGNWNGAPFVADVWTGPSSADASAVLKDYRRMVLEDNIRDGIAPATPAQIQAGAPRKSFIYNVAWSAAVMPGELKPPSRAELAGMRDVVDALKTYRLQGRARYAQQKRQSQMSGNRAPLGAPHYFWTGRLQVST